MMTTAWGNFENFLNSPTGRFFVLVLFVLAVGIVLVDCRPPS